MHCQAPSSTPAHPRPYVRAAVTALVGALTLAAVDSASAKECRVRFTEITAETYNSGGRKMDRLVLKGNHSYRPASNSGGSATTAFEIVDGDGYLTIAILTSRWRSISEESGSSDSARVSNAELQGLRQLVEMGQAYYTRGLEIISANPPENYERMRDQAIKKMRLLGEVLIALSQARDYRPSDNTVVIDIAWFRQLLGRFGLGGDLQAQYRDKLLNEGAPNLMCDPKAASPVVGMLACAGALPAPTYNKPLCPDGLSFDPALVPDLLP